KEQPLRKGEVMNRMFAKIVRPPDPFVGLMSVSSVSFYNEGGLTVGKYVSFGDQRGLEFYEWLTRSGKVDVDELIEAAVNQADLENDRLSVLEGARDEALFALEEADPNGQWWCRAINRVADQIDLRAVAEALLKASGKWEELKHDPRKPYGTSSDR